MSQAGRPTRKKTPPFGKKIAKLRKERGWTQPELAEKMATTVKAITYYEREAKNPTAKTIEKFAAIFNVPTSFFISEQKKPKRGPFTRLDKLTERLSKLPRSEQKVIIDMLESYLDKAS
jgi:transcriptional regulator with XRE-family HTH domain